MPAPTYAQLLAPSRLQAAWLSVLKRNKRGGVDGKTIEDFENNVDKNLASLLNDLTEKRYAPEPYLAISIAKKMANGKLKIEKSPPSVPQRWKLKRRTNNRRTKNQNRRTTKAPTTADISVCSRCAIK